MPVNDAIACHLCGLDCGRDPLTQDFDGTEYAFCCAGCMNVYAILLESGVVEKGVEFKDTELFRRSLEMGLISNPSGDGDLKPEIPPGAEVRELMLEVSGMWCSSCSWLIEHALCKEPGVQSATVHFASDVLKVSYYPQYLPPDRIRERVSELGYKAFEYTGDSEQSDAERKDLLLRLGVAVFLWINVMTLNAGIYARYLQDIPETIARFFPFLLMVLTAPAVFYSAQPILRLAWRGLLNRAIRMETLLALGILTAFGYSVHQTLVGGDHVYFDTTCALVALVLIGKWFERSGKAKTSRSISLMYRTMPRKARIKVSGRERFVALEALRPGDRFVVKAGERIPADGVVIDGESHVDESLLSGESAPVAKRPGSKVVGGSISSGGVLEIEASKVGDDSTLAQILSTVEAALSSRSSIEKTVDRVARVFVPGVILIAVAAFIGVWTLTDQGVGNALMRGISVLVIACPCALGIATPLAIVAAVGAASRNGILVSDSRIFEIFHKVDLIVFDKTGTITEGNFALLKAPPEHLGILASLETFSEHPLGRAIMNRAVENRIDLQPATGIEVIKGLGIAGTVTGRRVFIGNRELAGREAKIPPDQDTEAHNAEEKGHTVSFYGWDGEVKGTLVFGDQVREDVPTVIRELQHRGIHVMVVSGDSHVTTEWVSQHVGANAFRAEALPGQKATIVASARNDGKVVAMVGDGINDAPALAAADLGIAVASGTDIAIKTAALVLMTNDLKKILDAINLSSRTLTIIRQNLFWAFLYNVVGLSLAVSGILTPIMAAGAMVISRLSVIANSLRLCRDES
jgi:heavy metal translocating P-type ATPase